MPILQMKKVRFAEVECYSRRPAVCAVEHIPRASIIQQGSGNSLIISRDAVEKN